MAIDYRQIAGLPDPADLKADIQAQTEQNLSSLSAQQATIQGEIEFQRGQYDVLQEQMNESVAGATATLQTFQTEVLNSLNQPGIDAEALIAPYRDALSTEITNIRNAYGSQLRSQAVQLDSMMGAGEFGGNAYRAQQAYRTQMQDLAGQALGQIGSMTLQAEKDILTTSAGIAEVNQANRTQQLGLLGQSAGMAVEAASTFTRDYLGLLQGQSQSAYNLISLSANLDLKALDVRQQAMQLGTEVELRIAQASAQVASAYRQAEASDFAAMLQSQSSRAAGRSAERIAGINAQTQLDIANIQSGTSFALANIEAELETFGADLWSDVMSGFDDAGIDPSELFGGQAPLFINDGRVTGL